MIFYVRSAVLVCITVSFLISGAKVSCAETTASKVILPETAMQSERIFGLPGLMNVGRIAPGVFRGNQPQPEGYETLKKMGIRTVISFRARHGEKARVEAAGMRSIEIPISMLEKPRSSDIRKITGMMADPANQPLYVHCALGKDRTGIVVAAYRMDIDGWSLQDAIAEMRSFGFNGQWVHLKQVVTEYGRDRRK